MQDPLAIKTLQRFKLKPLRYDTVQCKKAIQLRMTKGVHLETARCKIQKPLPDMGKFLGKIATAIELRWPLPCISLDLFELASEVVVTEDELRFREL